MPVEQQVEIPVQMMQEETVHVPKAREGLCVLCLGFLGLYFVSRGIRFSDKPERGKMGMKEVPRAWARDIFFAFLVWLQLALARTSFSIWAEVT